MSVERLRSNVRAVRLPEPAVEVLLAGMCGGLRRRVSVVRAGFAQVFGFVAGVADTAETVAAGNSDANVY